MRESVANKMLRAEDYQKIRTLHQLYLFVCLYAFQRCFFCLIVFHWVKIQKLVHDSVADKELAADRQEGQ